MMDSWQEAERFSATWMDRHRAAEIELERIRETTIHGREKEGDGVMQSNEHLASESGREGWEGEEAERQEF